jgi:hypothetical protein
MTLPINLAAMIQAATRAEIARVGRDRFRGASIARRFAGNVPRATAYRYIARAVLSIDHGVPGHEWNAAGATSHMVKILTHLLNGGLCPDELDALAKDCEEADAETARTLTATAHLQRKCHTLATDLLALIAH